MSTRIDAAPAGATDLRSEQLTRLRGLLNEERALQQARAVELQDPDGLEPDLAAVLLTRCQETLEEIDAALARIRLGSYGTCLTCADAIPYERLEIVPAADRCVACQAVRDRVFR